MEQIYKEYFYPSYSKRHIILNLQIHINDDFEFISLKIGLLLLHPLLQTDFMSLKLKDISLIETNCWSPNLFIINADIL